MEITNRTFRIGEHVETMKKLNEYVHETFVNPELRLLVTEAASNCIRHSGGSKFTITVVHHHHHCLVEVMDDGTGYDFQEILDKAKNREVVPWESEGGRGIYLLYTYTEGNLDIRDRGRRVRFTLRD